MFIAIDADGGDYAPEEIVSGAVQASNEYDIDIALLGRKEAINTLLAKENSKRKVEVIDVSQAITCNESPVQAVRSKTDSAIVKGVQLVRDGLASAFVSAGNTGAVLTASFLHIKNLEGIERPALGVVIPVSVDRPFLLIDAGANVDCQPRFLLQFAQMGSIFARLNMGISSPAVGLLNNGEEEAKGSSLTREAYKLLKESRLNFAGHIEGQDLFKSKMDVLVTDGFTGNVLLKSMEGFAEYIKQSVKQLYLSQSGDTAKDLPSAGSMTAMFEKMDFDAYGGACLLGLRGNVIVAHGRSKARAIKNAVGLGTRMAAAGLVAAMKEELSTTRAV